MLSLKRVRLFRSAAALAGRASTWNLRIRFMEVDQVEGALLVSGSGDLVAFDDGRCNSRDTPLHNLAHLGTEAET